MIYYLARESKRIQKSRNSFLWAPLVPSVSLVTQLSQIIAAFGFYSLILMCEECKIFLLLPSDDLSKSRLLRILVDFSSVSDRNPEIQFATGGLELFSLLQTACIYIWANHAVQKSVNNLCEIAASGWRTVSVVLGPSFDQSEEFAKSLKSEEAMFVFVALVLFFVIFLWKDVLRALLAASEKTTISTDASTLQNQAVIAKHEKDFFRAPKLKRSKKIYNQLFKNIQSLNARLMKQIQKNTALLQNVEKLELENAHLKKEALSFLKQSRILAEEEVKVDRVPSSVPIDATPISPEVSEVPAPEVFEPALSVLIEAAPNAIEFSRVPAPKVYGACLTVPIEAASITKDSLNESLAKFELMKKKATLKQGYLTKLRNKIDEDERCSNSKEWKNSLNSKKIAAQVKFLELFPMKLDQFVAKVFRFRYTRCYENDEEMPGFSAKMDELCSIMPDGKEGLVTFELVLANAPFFNQMLERMFPDGNFSQVAHEIDELRKEQKSENARQVAREIEEQRCLNALLQFCPVGSDSVIDVLGGIEGSCKRYHAKRVQENALFDLQEFQSIIASTIEKSWGNGDDGSITRGLLQKKDCLVELGRLFLGEQEFVDSMTNLFPDFKEKLPLVEGACKFVNVAAGLENACDLYRARMLIRNEPDFELDPFKSAILGSFCRILETGDLERISREYLKQKGYLENLDLLFKGQDSESENHLDAFEEYMEALIPGFAEKLPDLKEAYRIEADVPGTFIF